MTFGGSEILIIAVVLIILFFGASKIPELARGIGQGITEFKNATEDSQKEQVEEENQSSSNKQG